MCHADVRRDTTVVIAEPSVAAVEAYYRVAAGMVMLPSCVFFRCDKRCDGPKNYRRRVAAGMLCRRRVCFFGATSDAMGPKTHLFDYSHVQSNRRFFFTGCASRIIAQSKHFESENISFHCERRPRWS